MKTRQIYFFILTLLLFAGLTILESCQSGKNQGNTETSPESSDSASTDPLTDKPKIACLVILKNPDPVRPGEENGVQMSVLNLEVGESPDVQISNFIAQEEGENCTEPEPEILGASTINFTDTACEEGTTLLSGAIDLNFASSNAELNAGGCYLVQVQIGTTIFDSVLMQVEAMGAEFCSDCP